MLIKQVLGADGERQCHTWRSTRVAIAARYPADLLPTGGLTLAEVGRDKRAAASKARWDAMTPEEQAVRLAKLTPFSKRDPLPAEEGPV